MTTRTQPLLNDQSFKRNKPSLLLDIDGVVVQYDFNKIVKEHFGVDISRFTIYAYDLADWLGVSQNAIDDMFREQVWGTPIFIDNALDVLQKIKPCYNIVVFSNRVKFMGYFGLLEWLLKWGIPFDGIDVNGEGCYDYHIDDRPKKLLETDSKMKLLFNQTWNAGCLDIEHRLKRVYTWEEVYNEVAFGWMP